ncbi:hypothetical protein P3E18_26140, partial [Pseudomonas aeruginosa]
PFDFLRVLATPIRPYTLALSIQVIARSRVHPGGNWFLRFSGICRCFVASSGLAIQALSPSQHLGSVSAMG